jgi:ankyrin repeat protein
MYSQHNIVTDDASVSFSTAHQLQQVQPTFDSGFHSGSIQPQPKEKSIAESFEYRREDSESLCNTFDHLVVSQIEDESSQQSCSTHQFNNQQYNTGQSYSVLPNPGPTTCQSSFSEYYLPDSDGDCQLHLAIASGFVEVVFALIRMAPHPSYLDIQNNELYAPLHIAVLMNQAGMVRRLVVAGATTDIRDLEGNTPLHLAAKRGFLDCAEALLRSISVHELEEASVAVGSSSSCSRSVIDLKNYQGEHCIHLATFGQHSDFIRLLCWNGADVNATEGRSGKTALHYAVNKRDLNLVTLLSTIRTTAGVQLNTRDWTGRSPIQCAAINGDADIVTFLSGLPGCDTSAMYQSDTEEDAEHDDEVCREYYSDIEVNGVPVLQSIA